MTLTFAAPPGAFATRVAPYLRARELEGRIYPDDVVRRLPHIGRRHPLAAEWRVRAASADRLLAHLRAQPGPLTVLDVCCGTGWLANLIAGIERSRVYALDINEPELRQGARVFGDRDNLSFIHGDATATPPAARVGVVIAASAIQYFPDLGVFLRAMRSWLRATGEVHLLDSPLYAVEEVPAARARTRIHYSTLGVPELADAYHPHASAELEPFDPVFLARPAPGRARSGRVFARPRSPFPWVRIDAASIPSGQ